MDKLRDHQEQEHPIAAKRKVSIHDVFTNQKSAISSELLSKKVLSR